MQLNERIKYCYKSGTQLWIVSDNPLSIPRDYSLYGYGFHKITPLGTLFENIFDFTLPRWLIKPGSTLVDYSAIPREMRGDVPSVSYKNGKESLKVGIPGPVFDFLVKSSKERKERTAKVPKELLAEIDFISKSGRLPDPDDWVEKTYRLWDPSLLKRFFGLSERKKTFFADPWNRLDSEAIDFILKYRGDSKIARNVFLIVGAPKMPTTLYKNWEPYLFQK